MFFLQFFMQQQQPIPKYTPAPPSVIVENISQYLQAPMSPTNRILAVILAVLIICFTLFVTVKAIINIWRE